MNQDVMTVTERTPGEVWVPGFATDEVFSLLDDLYVGSAVPVAALRERFSDLLSTYRRKRPQELMELDAFTPHGWFRSPDTIAYMLYADLFSPEAPPGEKLRALRSSIGYFTDLGVNLIHLLPIFRSSGDGGFAIDDYGAPDGKLGTLDDLKELISDLHAKGIRIALDFVLNHVSSEHPWARAARDPSDSRHPEHRNFFIWDDSGERWEGVREVFPDFAPGHWDYVPETGRWVWATFYKRYGGPGIPLGHCAQWDLNYRNPEVLFAMLECLLTIANWGVDLFRLDAIPHLWKEKGTRCRSLPEVYKVVKLLSLALEHVAPNAALLVEANETPDRLSSYFMDGGVQLAYHFPLMPALWNGVMNGDVRPIQKALWNSHAFNHECHWLVFTESHDELSLSHAGESAGAIFEYSCRSGCTPFGGAKRGVSGTTFSLLRGDVRRILLLWQIKLSIGWTPLFYMGEELGQENDDSYKFDAEVCMDSRFCKRVPMLFKDERHRPGSVQSYLYYALSGMIKWRKQHPCLSAPPVFMETGSESVLAFSKHDGCEGFIILANCDDRPCNIVVDQVGELKLMPYEFRAIPLQE